MRAELGDALTHFEHAAVLMPGDPEPVASLAAIAARQQCHGDARALAARALCSARGLVTADMAIAHADLLEGHADRSHSRITDLLGFRGAQRRAADRGAGSPCRRARRARQGRGSVRRLCGAQCHSRAVNAPRIATGVRERRIDQARRLGGWFERTPPGPWPTGTGSDTARSVR